MLLGDFARLNDYNPDAAFPAGSDEDEARWARERAAERLGITRRQQGGGSERGERVMGAIADLSRAILDPVVTELTDYSHGRVASEGPMTEEQAFLINQRDPGRATWEMLKATIPFRNPFGAVSQFEARGGQLFANAPKRVRVRAPAGFDPVGWQGPVNDLVEAGRIPAGTHANWYLRHDPKTGHATLSNESGPSGNVYAVNLKGGMTPEEMAAATAGQPSVLQGKRFDLRELRDQNAELVFGPTDKMAGGDWLQLPGASVRQEAGINFPFIHARTRIPNVPADAAPLYASVDVGAANKVNRVAEDVIRRGGVPYYVPLIMGPGAGDSTNQMAFSVLAQLRNANPGTKAVKALDDAVRAKGKGATNYPGFNSPFLDDWLASSGLAGRRAFTEGAASRSASDLTGVEPALVRYLNTDPRLRHTPSGSGGIVMGRMRPDVPVSTYPLHTNYGATFFGQRGEIGGLGGNMPFSLLAPDMSRALLKYRSPGGGSFADTPAIQVMRGLASDVPQTQTVTDEVVKNWLRWFERNPQGWAIPGAIGLGAYANQSSYR